MVFDILLGFCFILEYWGEVELRTLNLQAGTLPLNCSASPFCVAYFCTRVLFYPQASLDLDPPAYASPLSDDDGASLCAAIG
jgi:hypothetical protein